MKIFKYILLSASGIFVSAMSYAQYEGQIVQFSQAQSGAGARIQGMGNAQTALGGDFSSISSNPAGLGLFTKSEITLAPTLNKASSNSEYFGTSTNAERTAFGLDQLGAVFYSASKRAKGQDLDKGWLSVNFGIGYNKTQNFNRAFSYNGFNNANSVTDHFAAEANTLLNNGDPEVNDEALSNNYDARNAYKSFLIDYTPDGYSPSGNINGYNGGTGNNQTQVFNRWGSQSEFGLGLGANYENKFYIGASLNFTSVNYRYSSYFTEKGVYNGQNTNRTDADYEAYLDENNFVKGSGINLKMGAIYKPIPELKVGLSFATPTWYRMTESYSKTVDGRMFANNGAEIPSGVDKETPLESDFNYNIRTPYKLSAGLSYVIAKRAIVSGDIDFIDYKSANFSSDDTQLDRNMMGFTQNDLKSVINYRLGAEVKLTDELMLRGGYGFIANPYQNIEISSNIFSGGLGYRVKNIALDVTYVNNQTQFKDSPYTINNGNTLFTPTANVKNKVSNIVMSIGLSF